MYADDFLVGAGCSEPGANHFLPGAKTKVPGANRFLAGAKHFLAGATSNIPGASHFLAGAKHFLTGAIGLKHRIFLQPSQNLLLLNFNRKNEQKYYHHWNFSRNGLRTGIAIC
ncbi:MAG: hypothetical protein ABI426_11975 [Flavobacterium sp.]